MDNSVQFSSEPNNLYNLNTFKYSGLANKKAVAIAPADPDHNQDQEEEPACKAASELSLAEGFTRNGQDWSYRSPPTVTGADLKATALGSLAAVHRSLRMTKAGATKKKSKSRTPSAAPSSGVIDCIRRMRQSVCSFL